MFCQNRQNYHLQHKQNLSKAQLKRFETQPNPMQDREQSKSARQKQANSRTTWWKNHPEARNNSKETKKKKAKAAVLRELMHQAIRELAAAQQPQWFSLLTATDRKSMELKKRWKIAKSSSPASHLTVASSKKIPAGAGHV